MLWRGQLDFLYAFQNEKKIFSAADHRFKQTVVFAAKGGNTTLFRTRLRMGVGDSPNAHEIPADILRNDHRAMEFTTDELRTISPKTLSVVELGNRRDLDIFRTIYLNSFRIGKGMDGWKIDYAQEVNMTSDSKQFPPLDKWELRDFKPDLFGRWVGPDGAIALPLYQGRVIHHFDFWAGRYLHGAGRNVRWADNPQDEKLVRPQYLMSALDFRRHVVDQSRLRVAMRDVARSTDTRTLIAAAVPAFPCNHKVPILSISDSSVQKTVCLAALLSSLLFDFVVRVRLGGTSLVWSMLAECPLPLIQLERKSEIRLVHNSTCLTLLHRHFAPEWMKLKELYPELADREWKHWWAVTEADRLRLRVEIDALSADLYGLEPDDFDWIVRDDPKDPKGFYRVDRQLPFRERLTGLAAAAFRALKDGKWSADSAANLSNDEFFEIVGIPEMTTGPDPLIKKREGCHRWKPEEFGKDDPRYGWTWDHCWQDAVALLGSEEAVRRYVEQMEEKPTEKEAPTNYDGRTDLFGQPLPPKQGKLFQ